jgi:hypothetical protein
VSSTTRDSVSSVSKQKSYSIPSSMVADGPDILLSRCGRGTSAHYAIMVSECLPNGDLAVLQTLQVPFSEISSAKELTRRTISLGGWETTIFMSLTAVTFCGNIRNITVDFGRN